MRRLALACLLLLAAPALAQDVVLPEAGSVSREEGLAAFDRIHAVVSSPRCANCHVGPDNIPRWDGLGLGEDVPHGMNVTAGDSRIGVETLLCSTCHRTVEDGPIAERGAPPHVTTDWRLAPVEMQWHGRTAEEICAQLSDPDTNGGRDWIELAEHLDEDGGHGGFIAFGFDPGPGRAPAPGTLQEHIDDMLTWGAAGQPCPGPVGAVAVEE
ncbi:hypothetical protein [Wenxinia saemankumensis]|uniref:Cytochrome c domain-containing protein n=1 Tax=Wenxinia saemankumensis TaxID=1447782 RepID=A0A1M6G8B8_9RHOB|nr:hypothetical protein [Wenxinia saemankumensis]SHJ06169.1 hypothetical protein SAMN05444417_2741 [Wenxinia saemankumensis]